MKKKPLIISGVIIIAVAIIVTSVTVLPNIISPKEDLISDVAYVSTIAEINGENIGLISNRYSGIVETQDAEKIEADPEKVIKNTFVKEGDRVKKGDKLFDYDIEEMQNQLEQSKLELDEANAEINMHNSRINSLEKEKLDANANDKLSIENEISSEKIELKRAEYTVTNSKKIIGNLEKAVKDNVVKAQNDGIIKSVGYAEGNTDLSSITSGSGNAYITITTSENYRVKANISEENINSFQEGMKVIIYPRNNTDEKWTGTVKSIDTSQASSNNNLGGYSTGSDMTSTKYPVYIDIDNSNGLKVGQHITVELDLSSDTEKKDGLWLDEYYICDTDTSPYVWCKGKDGTLEKRSIEVGEYDKENAKYEVKSGLSESDYIAFPEEFLTEGMKVSENIAVDDIETMEDSEE